MAHYGWAEDDWNTLGRATMAGHLLECGAQVTGGYFADPGFKDVPDLHDVGFPIAEVARDGSFIITKADRTGGLVDARTVKEQLLYEVHDPAAYLTPDVVADISDAEVHEVGRDRIAVSGVRGHPRPATLKVNVCFDGGWLGEAEISYAGPNAEGRARLAAEVVRRRLGDALELRFDLIGVLSVFADDGGLALAARAPGDARDVRLRVAGTHTDRAQVERLLARSDGALLLRAGRRAAACARACAHGFRPCRASSRASGCRRASRSSNEHGPGSAPRSRPRPHRRQGRSLEHQRHRLSPGSCSRSSSSRSPRRGSQRRSATVARPRSSATCCRSCTP